MPFAALRDGQGRSLIDEEVRAIARLLPPARTTMLTGSAATEPRVRSSLDEKAVIHFATHGVVRVANPLTSFLALGIVADGSADGQLTADEAARRMSAGGETRVNS